MATKFIPAWKSKSGDRLIAIAENHLFDTFGEASDYQMSEFLFYIPLGVSPDGVFETEVSDDGQASFPHVIVDGPMGSIWAGISGPAIDAALEAEAV